MLCLYFSLLDFLCNPMYFMLHTSMCDSEKGPQASSDCVLSMTQRNIIGFCHCPFSHWPAQSRAPHGHLSACRDGLVSQRQVRKRQNGAEFAVCSPGFILASLCIYTTVGGGRNWIGIGLQHTHLLGR
ncbi:hypothetical protein HJG60_010767 [Phyllostomus discolor]|uniref:Uncharacterized protein n=1 Tax=Phyllostomus discolor TaxID=89673 RepID=A0A834ECN4_9CHIR|nr:hypothetical protein HJG60_010767 [Phyllostomus discolor]